MANTGADSARRKARALLYRKLLGLSLAWAATRTKETYLHAQYLRIRSRRGAKKAIGAVAASILTAAYHMFKNGNLYQDLGANHFDKRTQGKHVLQLVNRLKNLGFAVQITPMAA